MYIYRIVCGLVAMCCLLAVQPGCGEIGIVGIQAPHLARISSDLDLQKIITHLKNVSSELGLERKCLRADLEPSFLDNSRVWLLKFGGEETLELAADTGAVYYLYNSQWENRERVEPLSRDEALQIGVAFLGKLGMSVNTTDYNAVLTSGVETPETSFKTWNITSARDESGAQGTRWSGALRLGAYSGRIAEFMRVPRNMHTGALPPSVKWEHPVTGIQMPWSKGFGKVKPYILAAGPLSEATSASLVDDTGKHPLQRPGAGGESTAGGIPPSDATKRPYQMIFVVLASAVLAALVAGLLVFLKHKKKWRQ